MRDAERGYAELGAAIRQARRARAWSQQTLAEASGVSRPTIARFELGADISLSKMEAIAAAVDLQLKLQRATDTQPEKRKT